MHRRRMIIGSLLLAALAVAVVQSLPLRRYLVALPLGVSAVEYSAPRVALAGERAPPPPPLSPADAGIDPAALAAVVAYAEPRNTRALLVGRRGHIVFERYWEGAGFDTTVDVSGFAPVLVALTLGTQLIERRVASIDEPLSNYLDEWRGDARGEITLRDLLAGRSRLAQPIGWPWPASRASRLALGTDLHATLLDWPVSPDAVPRPNERVEAELLALVMARRAARPWAELLDEHLWRPLGAGAASLALDRSAGAARAACCIRTRIGDWMRVGELLANDGVYLGNQLTPRGWVRLMSVAASEDATSGFFMRVDGEFATRDVAWLAAEGHQRLWIVPSLGLVILRIGIDPPAAHDWHETMIPDTIIRATSGWKPVAAPSGTDPSKFAPH